MSEREYRQDRLSGDSSSYIRENTPNRYPDGRNPNFSYVGTELTLEELMADDEVIFATVGLDSESRKQKLAKYNQPIINRGADALLLYGNSEREGMLQEGQESNIPTVDKSTLFEEAENLGLNHYEMGKSVRDLSAQLSDLGDVTSESNTWWQDILNNIPCLGGLIEPDSGRMLVNLGDDGYALLTGDAQSIYSYVSLMNQYSANQTQFWQFPMLVGLEQSIVREAETIMIGSRSYDLKSFIKEAKAGSISINDRETEAVPLLNWMALQAGEQSTDIAENAGATATDVTFAAAISGDTIFTDPQSDGKANRLVDNIKSIYQLVKTAPSAEQTKIEKSIDDELLDIIEEDNRWGLTDGDLSRMVDNVERLERDWERKIEALVRAETMESETP